MLKAAYIVVHQSLCIQAGYHFPNTWQRFLLSKKFSNC